MTTVESYARDRAVAYKYGERTLYSMLIKVYLPRMDAFGDQNIVAQVGTVL